MIATRVSYIVKQTRTQGSLINTTATIARKYKNKNAHSEAADSGALHYTVFIETNSATRKLPANINIKPDL
jgi:uncharacterized surface protein with fasciclin (FAS1) repeats